MQKLIPADLMPLEQYARERPSLRAHMIEHRRRRQLRLGGNCSWSFEDRRTVQYQIQEMLRAERVFEQQGIHDELDAYNPLIPDGSNWKATLLLEFPDSEVRREQLMLLRGVESRCWVRVTGFDKVFAIADEDLPRENEEKTSAVHFLRFELSEPMIAALKNGAALGAGVDHDHYRHAVEPVPAQVRASLLGDLH
jgi:hypothetical protein